jgi:pyruvate kinase
MTMPIQFLSTLGPASMNDRVIRRLTELGVTLFRINLSHTSMEQLPGAIETIRASTDVPICLDSEGAQIRTGWIEAGTAELHEHAMITFPRLPHPGDATAVNLYPPYAIDLLTEGDLVSIDFNSVLVQIVAIDEDGATARVLQGGVVGRNKAVTVQRQVPLEPLSDKDREAVAYGVSVGIRDFALSFAQSAEDVGILRDLAGVECRIVSKIECRAGLQNLEAIATASDAILIDRGDLSREFPIERVPPLQKKIIRTARSLDRPCYVATNLLESMVTAISPTRAEVNDIFNTLQDGANGLVLAAETAIGNYPVECASMIARMIRQHGEEIAPEKVADFLPVSLLAEPVGGRLVADSDPVEVPSDAPRLAVGMTDIMDCRQFATGVYSPLAGFMGSDMLASVIADNRTPEGHPWTLPVVLQTTPEKAAGISAGEPLVLTDAAGNAQAVVDVTEIYQPDLDRLLTDWFGSDSDDHPGVKRVRDGGPVFIAGPVRLAGSAAAEFRDYALSPSQTRTIFSHKGWNRVVGFHTRNAPHRAHEFIQLAAMERAGADGLLISPVIGPKKPGDFEADAVLAAYQAVLNAGIYPEGRAVLAAFATWSRYAGPREAVFTALCRRNMGCSHFIIGRDHTGVGDFYAPDANIRFFEQLGDIGIEPLFFDEIAFDAAKGSFGPASDINDPASISGTEVRSRLREGRKLPGWFMRTEAQQALFEMIGRGESVFHE